MSRLTPFVKRHHYVSNFTSREINAQWFDCNRVCSLFIPRRIYTSPRILLSFFLFFVWFFFWPRLKRRRARRGDFFSLSLFWLSFLSALLFLPGSKKKQKSLSSLYPSFTTNARRNKERETNAREQSSANASPRWKSAAERAERNARRRRFSTLFLVFFFRERRGEALMRREKKPKIFLEREEKEKLKLKREFSGRKRERTEGKKMWEGGSIDRSKKKKIWPDNWIEQFELAS